MKAPKGRINSGLPEGFTPVSKVTFKFETIGDSIQGEVKSINTVKSSLTGKDQMVMTLVTKQGLHSVWSSAKLVELFTAVKPGDQVFIKYVGDGKAKTGQNAPKLFETGIKQS